MPAKPPSLPLKAKPVKVAPLRFEQILDAYRMQQIEKDRLRKSA